MSARRREYETWLNGLRSAADVARDAFGVVSRRLIGWRDGQVLRPALAELGIPPDALPELRGARVVVSVARVGPRTEIRRAMTGMGFVEGTDYVCAA